MSATHKYLEIRRFLVGLALDESRWRPNLGDVTRLFDGNAVPVG
jgi:hypothetical protein